MSHGDTVNTKSWQVTCALFYLSQSHCAHASMLRETLEANPTPHYRTMESNHWDGALAEATALIDGADNSSLCREITPHARSVQFEMVILWHCQDEIPIIMLFHVKVVAKKNRGGLNEDGIY